MFPDTFTGADIVSWQDGATTILALLSDAGRAWLVDHIALEGMDLVVSIVVSNGTPLVQEMREDGLSVLEPNQFASSTYSDMSR